MSLGLREPGFTKAERITSRKTKEDHVEYECTSNPGVYRKQEREIIIITERIIESDSRCPLKIII